MRRLAPGRGPVALGRHRLDHLFTGHRFALFGEDFGGGVQATQLAVLALGLVLLPFSLCLPLCLGLAAFAHDSPPFRWMLPSSGRAQCGPALRSYLVLRRLIKAIPAVLQGITGKG